MKQIIFILEYVVLFVNFKTFFDITSSTFLLIFVSYAENTVE